MIGTRFQTEIEKNLSYIVGNRPIELRILGVDYKGTIGGYMMILENYR